MTSGGGGLKDRQSATIDQKGKKKKEGKVKFLEMKREEVKIERKW